MKSKRQSKSDSNKEQKSKDVPISNLKQKLKKMKTTVGNVKDSVEKIQNRISPYTILSASFNTENEKLEKKKSKRIKSVCCSDNVPETATMNNNSAEMNEIDDKTNILKESKKNKKLKKHVEKKLNDSVEELLPAVNSDGLDKRTIFIGNLPVNFKKKKILKLLKQFGQVEKMRTRGAIPWIAKLPKKVAIHKQNNLPDEHPPLMVYASFKTGAEARNALKLNGEMYEDSRLRVTLSKEKNINVNQGVFVGNLPFNVKEDDVYQLFEQCGEIAGVRIIRDSQTGAGKGFGYVNFQSADSVELALGLNEEKLNGREIRVQRLLSAGKKKKVDRKKGAALLKLASNSKSSLSVIKSSIKVPSKTLTGARRKLNQKKKPSADDHKKKLLAKKLTTKNKKK